MGAGLEWFMINFKVGEANFYTTYKRRQALNKIDEVEDETIKDQKEIFAMWARATGKASMINLPTEKEVIRDGTGESES